MYVNKSCLKRVVMFWNLIFDFFFFRKAVYNFLASSAVPSYWQTWNLEEHLLRMFDFCEFRYKRTLFMSLHMTGGSFSLKQKARLIKAKFCAQSYS